LDPSTQRIWIYGGIGPVALGSRDLEHKDELWVYDIKQDQWELIPPLTVGPGVRAGHGMDFDPTRGELLLFGGDGNLPCKNDFWSYSVSDQTWSPLLVPPMFQGPPGRWWTSMTVDQRTGTPWVFFGTCGGFQALSTYLAFDYEVMEWTIYQTSKLPGPWERAAHVTAYDGRRGRILLYGGYIPLLGIWPDQVKEFTKVWSYDPSTNEWTSLTSGEDRTMHLWAVGAYDMISDLFLVYGGHVGWWALGEREYISDETLAFDPSDGVWRLLPGTQAPETKRLGATGAYCPCLGELFVFGGRDSTRIGRGILDQEEMAFFVPVETPASFSWDGSEASARRKSSNRWGTLSFSENDDIPDGLEAESIRLVDCETGETLQLASMEKRVGHGRWHIRFEELSPAVRAVMERGRLVLTGHPIGEPVNFIARVGRSLPPGHVRSEPHPTADAQSDSEPLLEVTRDGTTWLLTYTGSRVHSTKLLISDVAGRVILSLRQPFAPAASGSSTYRWNGTDAHGKTLPAGLYFIRVTDGANVSTRKVVLF
jgi:hypothetical protein